MVNSSRCLVTSMTTLCEWCHSAVEHSLFVHIATPVTPPTSPTRTSPHSHVARITASSDACACRLVRCSFPLHPPFRTGRTQSVRSPSALTRGRLSQEEKTLSGYHRSTHRRRRAAALALTTASSMLVLGVPGRTRIRRTRGSRFLEDHRHAACRCGPDRAVTRQARRAPQERDRHRRRHGRATRPRLPGEARRQGRHQGRRRHDPHPVRAHLRGTPGPRR